MKILVVEDTPINQTMARLLLEGEGHEALIAARGAEALAHLEEGGFDLALMDLNLPDMSGLEVARKIRKSEKGGARRTPIIALSGSKSEELERQCLEAGMDAFWVKPIRADLLTAFASSAEGARKDARPGYDNGQERGDAPGVFDREEAMRIVDGDRRLLAHIASMFLESLPAHIGEMSLAMSRSEREKVSRLAHHLAGTAANFGPTRLGHMARKLEFAAGAGEEMRALDGLFSRLINEAMRMMDAISAYLAEDANGG